MKNIRKNEILALGIILATLIIDQWIKIYVKLHFYLHESVEVTSWFHITFIENNGMAYGMEIGDKLALTLFRILVVAFFGYALWRGIKAGVVRRILVVCISMAIAGALGNILDCIFYGQMFTDSYGRIAALTWTSGEAGYAPIFRGRVVDMLYFPLVEFNWPDWVPVRGQEMMDLGGFKLCWPKWMPCSDDPFRFFAPVFNFADAVISVGFAVMLLFYHRDLYNLLDRIERDIKQRKQRKEKKA